VSEIKKISRGHYAGIVGLVLIVVGQGPLFGWDVVDDAFITFRYAANLADGHGLVFNIGDRVEGYSNFLWNVLLAASGSIGCDIVLTGKLLSLIFACLAVVLTWVCARMVATQREWPPGLAWVPPLMLALYPGWSYWAYGGLESTMLACLILLFLLFGSSDISRLKNLIPTILFGLLATLTRWEVVLLWPVVALPHFFNKTPEGKSYKLRTCTLLFLLAVGFGVYFIWRAWYYGELLPNTFYAKANSGIWDRLIPWGLNYTGELAIFWWVPLSMILWFSNCRQRLSLVLGASLLIYIGYVTWTGGDHFAWLRFYMPILPIAALMLTEVIHVISGCSVKHASRAGLHQVFVGGAVILICIGSAYRIDYRSAQVHHSYVRWWRQVGPWSRDAFPDQYCLAVIPAGAIPYYSRHSILDLMGLTDYETAHFGDTDMSEAPGHQKSSIATVLRRKPEIIWGEALAFSDEPSPELLLQKTNRRMLRRLYRMPEFLALYKFCTAKIGQTYTCYWQLKSL